MQEENVSIFFSSIHTAQQVVVELKKLLTDLSEREFYGTKMYAKIKLGMKKSKFEKKWWIFVPKNISKNLIAYYHKALFYPRIKRMEESVLQLFMWPGCSKDIAEGVQTYGICQKNKNTNDRRSGKMSMKNNFQINPLEVMSVDLIGLWKSSIKKLNIKQKETIQINALTMMDDATGWLEIIPIMNKQSKEIVLLLDREWFCIYPKPLTCRHNNGGEYDGR